MRTREWRATAHEISQAALDVVPHAWGPDNWARSLCASLVTDALGGGTELIWSHKTEPTTPKRELGDTHTGTHFLRLSHHGGSKYLEGRYITDRLLADGSSRTGGFIKLVWVSTECKNSLAFSESGWGMPKPEGAP